MTDLKVENAMRRAAIAGLKITFQADEVASDTGHSQTITGSRLFSEAFVTLVNDATDETEI
ncbi:MAG: hypothetical protein NVS3B21_36780 [Acidimicrobiales bacterium]